MKKILLFLWLVLMIAGCRENPPVAHDGACELTVKAYYPNPDSLSAEKFLPAKNAKVVLSSEYGIMVEYTDNNGILYLKGIPSAVYRYTVTLDHPILDDFFLTSASSEFDLKVSQPIIDTAITSSLRKTGLCINEFYVSGPPNSSFWFYDQYIELYNAGKSIMYLDGKMIMKFSTNAAAYQKGPGADEGEDGDIDGATIIFKFPGEPGGKTYPVNPGIFLVLAVSANDFTKNVPNSIDLSKADWEFYDQNSVTDTDNPNSRNLINMNTKLISNILFALPNGVIVLSDGRDTEWEDGIEINTVIDGVQYNRAGIASKTLDNRVDKSFVYGPPSYSGKSLQRRQPGLDTQDAMMDWEILNKPTPGRQ